MLYQKGIGNSKFVVEALKSYGAFLFYSIPLLCIFATSSFAAFKLNFDKKFSIRVVPIIATINTVFLLLFFLINIDYAPIPKDKARSIYPEIKTGYVNQINGYRLYVNSKNKKGNIIKSGVLFQDNAYLISSGKITKKQISLYSTKYISDTSICRKKSSFSVPHKEKLFQLQNTGISAILLSAYDNYTRKVRTIFNQTFASAGIVSSIIAILFMSIGFYAVVFGIAVFFNHRDIFFLSFAAIMVLSFAEIFLYRYYLAMVQVIKLGIKNAFWQVTIPGIVVGIFAGLLGFGLIQLKDFLNRKATGAV